MAPLLLIAVGFTKPPSLLRTTLVCVNGEVRGTEGRVMFWFVRPFDGVTVRTPVKVGMPRRSVIGWFVKRVRFRTWIVAKSLAKTRVLTVTGTLNVVPKLAATRVARF